MLAEPVYFLEKGLCGDFDRVDGVLLYTEHDLHAFVLEIETCDIGP